MERINSIFDVNSLPVHLFIKSPKEAKKIDKQPEPTGAGPVVYKRERRFKSIDWANPF